LEILKDGEVVALVNPARRTIAKIPTKNNPNDLFIILLCHFAVTMVYKDLYFLGYSCFSCFYKNPKIYITKNLFLDKMVIKAKENVVGAWAFLIGVILALVIGLSTTILSIPFLTQYSAQIYAILVILGLIVGFMNIAGKDTLTFLWAGTVLVIVSRFGMESVQGTLIGIGIGDAVTSIFAALLALFVPATIVVALKTVFSIAKV
jgi:hypothetical protein